MPIVFKFRSSKDFESLDLGGRSSISVRDLKDRIIAQKKLKFCHDFELLFSDAKTGQAFDDEWTHVMEGSSLVIKRVPAWFSDSRNMNDGSVARNDEGNVERVAPASPPPPLPRQPCSRLILGHKSDAARGKLKLTANEKNKIVPRQMRTMLDMDLPAELRCSLCTEIFKDAVMVRCCQHSFCETCIRSVLLERGRCPKCSSMKYTAETLLPNLSLRQAIDHFLEAQAVYDALQNKNPQDVPDVESGVQEETGAISIRNNEPPRPPSLLATRRLPNQVTGGTSAPSPLMIKQMEDEGTSSAARNCVAGFQGVPSSSRLPQNFLPEEVYMAAPENTGIGVTALDGSRTLMPSSGHRKYIWNQGDRNCYMCGSPDHLIRDCPAASSSHPHNHTGDAEVAVGMPVYGPTYWHGNAFPLASPHANIYGNPGRMMPLDPAMAPISPFGVPSHMSCLYNGMSGTYGYTRMGGGCPPMAPAVVEGPLPHQAFVVPQDGALMRKTLNEEQDFDNNRPEDYDHEGSRATPRERRSQLDKVTAGALSDCDGARIHKEQPDQKNYSSCPREPAIQLDEELPSTERKHNRFPHQSVSHQLDKGITESFSDYDSPRILKKHPDDKSYPRKPATQSDEETPSAEWGDNRVVSHQSVSQRDQHDRDPKKSYFEAQELSDSSNRHGEDQKRHHDGICLEKQNKRKGSHASEFRLKSIIRVPKEVSDTEKVASDNKKQSHRHHDHPDSSSGRNFVTDLRQFLKDKEASRRSRSSRKTPKSKDNQSEYDRWDGSREEYGGEKRHKRRRTQ